MVIRVFFVVLAKVRINVTQPKPLLLSCLQISSDTDPHPHVSVDDAFGLLERARNSEAVLVDSVQVPSHLT